MAKIREKTEIEGKVIDSDEFYQKASAWATQVRAISAANSQRFKKGKEKTLIHGTWKSGKKKTWKKHKSKYYPDGSIENKLAGNISFKVYEKAGITDNIGFKFPRHGVFREFGVGNGQSINGKQAKNVFVKRSQSDWLDDPIDSNMEKLADIAVEFYGDQAVVNPFGMRIKNKL